MNSSTRSVVFHVSGPTEGACKSAVSRAANLLHEHPGTIVEIVATGIAVRGLISDAPASIALNSSLSEHPSVSVVACANALRAHHISPEHLAPFVRVVPAGVARIVERQWEGWALFVSGLGGA